MVTAVRNKNHQEKKGARVGGSPSFFFCVGVFSGVLLLGGLCGKILVVGCQRVPQPPLVFCFPLSFWFTPSRGCIGGHVLWR